ncbi:MAG: hypothetical protein H6711_30255 [Myxococcales bacterium]|nr:hypothetical protein [Myxococcales bacterium]
MSEPDHAQGPLRLCDFPPVGRDEWRSRAERELAGEPLERLTRRTRDGLAIAPLYGPDDASAADPASARPPGSAPFLRGTRARAGWRIRQVVDAPDPAAANADARGDLAHGLDSVWIRLDEGLAAGLEPASAAARPGVQVRGRGDLAALLDGVDLAASDLVIEAGAGALPLVAGVLDLAEEAGIDPSGLQLTIGGDPLAALATHGRLACGVDRAFDGLAAALAELARRAPAARGVIVSTIPYADAGADASEELAILLAGILETLRRLGARGLGVEVVAPRILAALSVDRDLFLGIAKIRAARALAARMLAACGAPVQAQALAIHVEGAWRELSRFDPWVNLLRGTVSAFVGAVAGAESVATPPFTAALGLADEDARRYAGNTQLLLREESHLDQVIDPTGGSWCLESLTERLERSAWARLQAIEAAGGLAAALAAGTIQARIAEQAAASAAAVACGRTPITGVNRYAILDEATPPVRAARPPRSAADEAAAEPLAALAAAFEAGERAALFARTRDALLAGATLPAILAAGAGAAGADAPAVVTPLVRRRLAADFEELRAAGALPVALACVGALAAIKPRIDFIRALLASGGLEAVGDAALHADADAAAAAFAAAPGPVAVVIARDDAYPALLPDLIPRLRSAGARLVAIAGRPREAEAALRDAGVDLFLALGDDALTCLRTIREEISSPLADPPKAAR